MREYLNIGSTPAEEDCAQIGSDDYAPRAKAECKRFIEVIRKKLGNEPAGATLKMKGFPHDFGTYYEVVCEYDENNEKAMNYAFKCESDAPTTWE